jgi:hypothetical protein
MTSSGLKIQSILLRIAENNKQPLRKVVECGLQEGRLIFGSPILEGRERSYHNPP